MNNKVIKEDGGIIGLTENKISLERWLLGAPEINLHLFQFEKCYGYRRVFDVVMHSNKMTGP